MASRVIAGVVSRHRDADSLDIDVSEQPSAEGREISEGVVLGRCR